jgi:hypothetical protein
MQAFGIVINARLFQWDYLRSCRRMSVPRPKNRRYPKQSSYRNQKTAALYSRDGQTRFIGR